MAYMFKIVCISAFVSFASSAAIVNNTAQAVAPVITEDPRDLRVHKGSPVTLNCGVYGVPAPTVSWYKDGRRLRLKDGGDGPVLLPGGGLFFLRSQHNHRRMDSGEYTCRAENEFGVVYSQPASLTVTYLKHEFGHVPKLITAEAGHTETVALSCFPPDGNPRPTIAWWKEGAPLALAPDTPDNVDAKHVLDPSGILMVRRLTKEDSGHYECVVSNEEGVRRDSPVSLVVTAGNEGKPEDRQSQPIGGFNRNTFVDSEDDYAIDWNVEPELEYVYDNDVASNMQPPVITESVLLDRVTGMVAWLPSFTAPPLSGKYVVRVAAGAPNHADNSVVSASVVEVTNITVDADVTRMKLHSLDPDLVYLISVAALRTATAQDGKELVVITAFSERAQLRSKRPEMPAVAVDGDNISEVDNSYDDDHADVIDPAFNEIDTSDDVKPDGNNNSQPAADWDTSLMLIGIAAVLLATLLLFITASIVIVQRKRNKLLAASVYAETSLQAKKNYEYMYATSRLCPEDYLKSVKPSQWSTNQRWVMPSKTVEAGSKAEYERPILSSSFKSSTSDAFLLDTVAQYQRPMLAVPKDNNQSMESEYHHYYYDSLLTGSTAVADREGSEASMTSTATQASSTQQLIPNFYASSCLTNDNEYHYPPV